MDQAEIKERLRNCIHQVWRQSGHTPLALLFIPYGLDWAYDEDSIFDIPVLRASGLVCTYWGIYCDDCPFVPLFGFGVIDKDIRRTFARAWDEYMPTPTPTNQRK
jgi:hypothetical protein